MERNKKIGIITFHRANNYGAVLQAYALTTYLNNHGYNAEIVDYRCEYIENYYKTKKKIGLKDKIKTIIYTPIRKSRHKSFEIFRDTYLKLSKTYTKSELDGGLGLYDCLIFGSDQIWNLTLSGNDWVYLGDIKFNKNKIAYAASFGNYLPDNKMKEKYASLLSSFSKVSTREKSGMKLYGMLTGKTAEVVSDPVFLLNKEIWEKLCNKTYKEKYILIYHLQGGKTHVKQIAERLSKETGLKIIELQSWPNFRDKRIKKSYVDSPEDFISKISFAEYVVTDSFHCTAFSLIFQKKVWAVIDSQIKLQETRVGNLMKELLIENRAISNISDNWNYDAEIDYDAVNKRLFEIVNTSKRYLYEAIR